MDNIVKAYKFEYMSQKEIALKFRVTVQLVRDLIRDSKKFPEKKEKMKDKLMMNENKKEVTNQAII